MCWVSYLTWEVKRWLMSHKIRWPWADKKAQISTVNILNYRLCRISTTTVKKRSSNNRSSIHNSWSCSGTKLPDSINVLFWSLCNVTDCTSPPCLVLFLDTHTHPRTDARTRRAGVSPHLQHFGLSSLFQGRQSTAVHSMEHMSSPVRFRNNKKGKTVQSSE